MGNAQGLEQPEQTYEAGFHVLQVHKNSPGDKGNLRTYVDFIVSANGVPLDKDDRRLQAILSENIDKPVRLVIYNSKTTSYRETVIVPTNNWGGAGVLGVSIRWAQLKDVNDNVWHVLTVYSNSPASKAGLREQVDYIVGSPDYSLIEPEDFFTFISQNMGKEVHLWVYNVQTTSVRLITIVPDKNWGGEGSLGCDVGYGYLHKIPKQDLSVLQSSAEASRFTPDLGANPALANNYLQSPIPSQISQPIHSDQLQPLSFPPIQTVQPSQPVHPVPQTAFSGQPVQPFQPLPPVQPIQPVQPVPLQIPQPVQIAQPVHPVQPVQIPQPAQFAQPTQIAQPVQPSPSVQSPEIKPPSSPVAGVALIPTTPLTTTPFSPQLSTAPVFTAPAGSLYSPISTPSQMGAAPSPYSFQPTPVPQFTPANLMGASSVPSVSVSTPSFAGLPSAVSTTAVNTGVGAKPFSAKMQSLLDQQKQLQAQLAMLQNNPPNS